MQIDTHPMLRRILALDAASCAAMGLGLVAAAAPLAALTALPAPLLLGAGLLLLPVAAFIAAFALRDRMPAWALRVIVFGNAGWVAASLGVLAVTSPNAIGTALVLGQAAAVAVLTALEATHLRPSTRLSA